jgi:CIC family chloride channel protein
MRPRFSPLLDRLRASRGSLSLALAGALVGACAGLVSIALRGMIELWQFVGAAYGGFARVPAPLRAVLPLTGVALTIGAIYALARGPIATGVPHVLERLTRSRVHLPARNALAQLVAASLLLGFGMSMGREGPAIHVGAATGTLIGERLRMSDAALRTLLACGVAASIGAAFNTPLAGVIVAIEVILVEYTAGGFGPVLIAAVSGATFGRLFYGVEPAFVVPNVFFGSLWELPWIVFMGLAIGAYAAAFVALSRCMLRRTRRVRWWVALLIAGALVGIVAAAVPQVMGVGYDIIEQTLHGRYAVGALVLIVAAKLAATAIGVGFRVPAGLIGPTFVMGAAAGGLFGALGAWLAPHAA